MNKLIKEIFVIIGVSALLGIFYNSTATKPLAWLREARVEVSVSDSDIFGNAPKDTASVATPESPKSEKIGIKPDEAKPTPENPKSEKIGIKAGETKPAGESPKPEKIGIKPETPTAKTPSAETPAKPAEKLVSKTVSYDQVVKLVKNPDVLFIDARNAKEYAEGHIGNAINIYTPDFQKHIGEVIMLPRDKVVVVYCGGGACELSHELADQLVQNFQFSRVFVYTGGWTEWSAKK